MKAILLAAGLGTRLRPITDTIPKCLVPINGKPLLGYWLDSLAGAGITSILINLHHHADQVRSFVEQRPDCGNVTLVFEETLLGTAGTVRINAKFCEGEPTMVIHADNFCTSNLKEFMRAHAHRPAETDMTMMTFRTSRPETCGIVEIDERRVMTGFYEKVIDPPGNLANGAVYICEPPVIDYIVNSRSSALDISRDTLPGLLHRIHTWPTDGIHIDVGTPEALDRACKAVVHR
jgi:mannose-1-phosphate guanylyltransferase